MKAQLIAACLLAALPVKADTLTGRVVAITDGDSLTVVVDRREVKVQLADIDAPDSRQAFGTRSKQALSDICLGKDARLETRDRDGMSRTIATVYCAGRNANAEQVWQGMAWVFERYAKPDSPLYILQEQARAARRGLWSEPNPVAPWELRRREQERKVVAPSGAGSSAAVEAQPQTAPRKWVCDRKEAPARNGAVIDCGWR